MDLISATYNKLEVLAVAADRILNTAVERCETWLGGRRTAPEGATGRRKSGRLAP
jgi:hypothetical protein